MAQPETQKQETEAGKSDMPASTGREKVILFRIAQGLSDRDRDSVLHNVVTLSGIFAVAAVYPEAVTEGLKNEFYATVDEKADFANLVKEIDKCSGVYNTWMPPQP